MAEIARQLEANWRNNIDRLRDRSRVTALLGPVGSFRVQYTLERREISVDDPRHGPRSGTAICMTFFEMIPVASQLGESLEGALAPDSDFRKAPAQGHPGRTTVTLWTYPDSFAQYRRLKEELYRMGFSTAAWPLADGERIRCSPYGTKSAAE